MVKNERVHALLKGAAIYETLIPYTDALVYSAESFKYKQPGILNKVV